MLLNKTFSLKVSTTIRDFCQIVLKSRFPGDPIRQEINDSDGEKLNFACPYCGDSAHDPNKKRGHLYLASGTYKCYNDGCSVWVPLDRFVSNFAIKYGLEVPNFSKKPEFKPKLSPKKKGFLIEFLINREVGRKLLDFGELVSRFSLKPCKDADAGSLVAQFVETRGIDRLQSFEQSCYYDSRQDKIYIFNLDLRSGKVLGFALRKLDDAAPGPKYNIKNYSELKKNGLVRGMEDEFISEIDQLNNYFNILNVDFTRKVTITEGQIDSMFVDNCIATTGVTKSKALLHSLVTKKNSRILFDNDKAGKGQTIELLKKGYSVFLWNKAIYALRRDYPESMAAIRKIKDVNDLFKFLSTKDPGMDFSKFNGFIDRYFSDSPFDLLLV
jgi:hypothetical protein